MKPDKNSRHESLYELHKSTLFLLLSDTSTQRVTHPEVNENFSFAVFPRFAFVSLAVGDFKVPFLY